MPSTGRRLELAQEQAGNPVPLMKPERWKQIEEL
jgi:hypothetical protein